jgi:hypothetical protein
MGDDSGSKASAPDNSAQLAMQQQMAQQQAAQLAAMQQQQQQAEAEAKRMEMEQAQQQAREEQERQTKMAREQEAAQKQSAAQQLTGLSGASAAFSSLLPSLPSTIKKYSGGELPQSNQMGASNQTGSVQIPLGGGGKRFAA